MHEEEIVKIIHTVYGTAAVSKVAHSEHMKALIQASKVDTEMRSDLSLTMSLLGLMSEGTTIEARLSKEFRKQSAAK